MARIKYKGKVLSEAEYKKKKKDDKNNAILSAFTAIAVTLVFLNLPGMAIFTALNDFTKPSDIAASWVVSAFISLIILLIVRLTTRRWKAVFLRYACICALTGVVVATGAFGSAPDMTTQFASLYFPDSKTADSEPLMAAAHGNNSSGFHRVQPGDNLSLLAQRYGKSVAHLQAINGLSGTTIHIGQEVRY